MLVSDGIILMQFFWKINAFDVRKESIGLRVPIPIN